jgi:hypothetical protein
VSQKFRYNAVEIKANLPVREVGCLQQNRIEPTSCTTHEDAILRFEVTELVSSFLYNPKFEGLDFGTNGWSNLQESVQLRYFREAKQLLKKLDMFGLVMLSANGTDLIQLIDQEDVDNEDKKIDSKEISENKSSLGEESFKADF